MQRCGLADAFLWWLGRVDTGSKCAEGLWVESQQCLTELRMGRERGQWAKRAAAEGERSWKSAN